MASKRFIARMNPDMSIQHRHHLEADRAFGFTQIDLGGREVTLKQLQFTLGFRMVYKSVHACMREDQTTFAK